LPGRQRVREGRSDSSAAAPRRGSSRRMRLMRSLHQ
jgi:hypothetical protein